MSGTSRSPSDETIGPESVVDGNVAVFDGPSGKVLKDGGVGLGILVVTTITGDLTLTAAHTVVLCDTTTGAFNVTLPAAADNVGRLYFIKNIGSTGNAVTIVGNIDDSSSKILASRYAALTLVADATGWHIL